MSEILGGGRKGRAVISVCSVEESVGSRSARVECMLCLYPLQLCSLIVVWLAVGLVK